MGNAECGVGGRSGGSGRTGCPWPAAGSHSAGGAHGVTRPTSRWIHRSAFGTVPAKISSASAAPKAAQPSVVVLRLLRLLVVSPQPPSAF